MEGFFFFWVLLAILVAFLANSRGRSGIGYFLLSIICSPILGLLIVLLTRNLTYEYEKEALRRIEQTAQLDAQRMEHEKHLESIRAISSSKPMPLPESTLSVADEIRKLGDLKAAGLITDAEFQDQKNKLFSKTNA